MQAFHSLDGGSNNRGSWSSLNKSNNMSNSVPAMNSQNTTLNLNMTAKELRAQLAARKKYDPKKDSLDFKKKYDIVQKL